MDSQAGKAWKEPPADAKVLPGKWGTKKGTDGSTVANVTWAHPGAGGAPQAKQANELDLVPGDYIQGNPNSPDKGTIYVIVKDPTDSYMGLAYYKLTEADGVSARRSSRRSRRTSTSRGRRRRRRPRRGIRRSTRRRGRRASTRS
jgi:hypothetical protein